MLLKNQYSFEYRFSESHRLLVKYPYRVPIICESKNNILDKNKYLVPLDLTLGQFQYVIRRRMRLPQEKALFLFINGNIFNSSQLISSLYDQEKDEDGFLYINYSFENTFG